MQNNEDKFFRQVLPNGLTVIFEKREIPTVSIIAATRFGSGHEDEKIKGLAHLLEHTVFKRTKTKTGEQLTSLIEKKGGQINAYTSEEVTAFWTKLKAENFEVGMDVLADMMMNPSLNKKDLDVEKKVILEEIRNNHDIMEKYVLTKLFQQLYASPFGLPILGTPQTIKAITRPTINKYHGVFYSPSSMVISVVGKADVDKIWNFSRKYFMRKQVQKQIDKKMKVTVAPGPFGSVVEKRNGIDQAHIAIGYQMPSLKDPLRYAAEIMNIILGVGQSSKLFQQIREKKGFAFDVYSNLNQGLNQGDGYIYMGAEKSKHAQALKLAIAELKNMQSIGPEEVEQAKEQLIGLYTIESENTDKVAQQLLDEQLAGDAKTYYQYPEKIKAVTTEQVRKVAELAASKIATVVVLPE